MTSVLNPYLNFNGNARQALEFYTSVFGGKLTLSTFAEFGATTRPTPTGSCTGSSKPTPATRSWPPTSPATWSTTPRPGSRSASGDDGDALHGYWEQLAAGGATTMPLQKQVWGDEFGMCVDQFGISWLVNISQPQA